jgi:diguanylate cyclase (GGDEF)-like protein/PAS domain S-box-containing protein
VTNAGATILIVDDEIQNRKLLEALLQHEGYRTLNAANGEAALAAIAGTPPDLVILDVMMPGMNGYEVAQLLKNDVNTAGIPIIMVTALNERSARLAALEAGVEDFLTKPVDRAELWLRVRNMLRLKSLGDLLQKQSSILELKVQERTAELQRFRTAMDCTADAIMLVSRSTMLFIEVNATACELFGYTREELLKMGPAQISALPLSGLESPYDATLDVLAPKELTQTLARRKDKFVFPVEVSRQALYSNGEGFLVNVVRDITERKEAELQLNQLAHYDLLTGLPNRGLYLETLRKSVAYATESGQQAVIMFLDLDNFKNVNDTLGHAVGDDLLMQVSDRLVKCVRPRDTVGRMGGDEFALVLEMQNVQQGVAIVANRIRTALKAPFIINGNEMMVTASIGVTIHPQDSSDPATLIKYADIAMYNAKHAGRDTFRFFTAQMNIDAVARQELETALRKAIENEEFVLFYQPKVHLNTGRIAGLEALLRWDRPGHGLVSPDKFIPVLEETGLIVRVGSWAIAAACSQIGKWMRTSIGPVQIAVNVAGRQFIEGDLEGDVNKALAAHDIPANLLELELTESSLMANTERTIDTLKSLTGLGVQISIDDFGTGYSSLAYLRRFPINKLKIDIAFVRNITTNADDAAIARTIIRMAHSLKLEVIAEGVETAEQLAYLRDHRCDQMQGFYFSRPLPASDIEKMLCDGKSLHASQQIKPRLALTDTA